MTSKNRTTILAVVGFVFFVLIFIFLSMSFETADASPLKVDPTPTPQWYSQAEGTTTATSDGNIGATYGNVVTVPANDTNEAVVVYVQKNCPTGSNNHWAKGRWEEGSGWTTFFNSQTCGFDDWKWYFGNNNYDSTTVGNAVESLFPVLSGEPSSGTYAFWNDDSDFQAYTEQGTGGDAGFQSIIEIYSVNFGQYDCEDVDPDDREFISTGLLHGDDDEGETFQLVPNQEYMLIIGGGPWNDGTDDRYDAGIRFRSSHAEDPPAGEWTEWMELGDVDSDEMCSETFLDPNGSYIIFEADPDEQSIIQFRVNDTDGEFDDNTGDIEYYWLGPEGSSQGCEDLWTAGSKVADYTITESNIATDYLYDLTHYYAGGNYDGLIAPGESYLYKVIGTFSDNGTDSNDTIVKAGASGTEWTDPADAFLAGVDACEYSTADNTTYYGTTVSAWDPDFFSIPGSTPYGRINDGSGSFADNTGSLQLQWYEGEWDAPKSDCATTYSLGTFIESPFIFADLEDGENYPQQTNGFVVGQAYYIESQGTPYSLNGDPSWDFEVKNEGDSTWSDPEVFFDCVEQKDQNRYGYWWTATDDHIDLRAEHSLSGFDANVGTVKFNLYGAIPNVVPDGETCSDYYVPDTLVWYDSFDASTTGGYSVDHSVFDPGTEYLIKVTGAYTDPDGTGKTMQIRRYTPGMGSVDWSDPEDWDAGLCYTQNDGYDWIYFQASALADYEIRAHTPTGNSGNMGFEIWSLAEGSETPAVGCEYDYSDVANWYVVKQGDIINANNSGVETDGSGNVTAITGYILADNFTANELIYKIETGYVPNWVANTWDLQVSTDGGSTWVFLEDWVDCWVDLGDEYVDRPVGRGYFTTPVDESGPFILRVYDVGGVYWNNEGGVSLSMWVDSQTADPGDVWGDPTYPQSWGEGCTAKCVSPGFLQVGEWVEYARCRLTAWLAWCPKHAKELRDMQDAFSEIEPFRTINELLGVFGDVRDEVESYSWRRSGTEGGGTGVNDYMVQSPEGFLFAPGEGGGVGIDDNWLTGPETIWGSGELDLMPDNAVTFKTACDVELAEVLGTRLSQSMCFAFNVLNVLGLRTWFQFVWDALMFIAFLMYLKKNWIDRLQ